MSEWKEYKLGELIAYKKAELQTGPFGTMLNSSEYIEDGIPVIAVQDIADNKLVYHKFVYVSESVAERLSRYRVKENDIIFGRKGAVERRALIKKVEVGWLQGSDCIRLRFDVTVDSKFVSYQLGSNYHSEWLHQNAGGATMPSLNQKILELLPLRLPGFKEQTAIAEVLSSLDDKIDLLHRQNKTLEQLAETLFRQWFVEEAEEGWEEVPLDEIAEYLNGLALQKFRANGNDSLPVIKIKEMKQGISDNSDRCSRELPEKYIIHDGDILFSWSGSLEVVIWHGGEGALNQHLFKVSSEKYPKWFCYLATKHHLDNFKMIAESKSTTMGHIQREQLSEATIPIPPKQIFSEFDKQIAQLIEKKIANNSQIKTLTNLRDTLLPKLMSGEARIKKPIKI